MKNLLMVVLVLALAATASATVSMVVYNVSDSNAVLNDGDTIAIGNVIRVAINDTAPAMSLGAGFGDFTVGVTAGTYNAASDVWGPGPYSSLGAEPWDDILPPAATLSILGAGFEVKLDGLMVGPIQGPPDAGDIVSFTFTATDATTIDPSWGSYKSDDLTYPAVAGGGDSFGVVGLVLAPIPEPMTIALLGLGGLFLRRRK